MIEVPFVSLEPGQTANVPLNQIKPNLVALRPAQIESDTFARLEQNIKTIGAKYDLPGKILQPIRVRLKTDAESKPFYELTDGLQRYTIAERLGMETIPTRLEEDETGNVDMLVEQLALNITAVATTPTEMSRQLHRILEDKPLTTIEELAQITGMSTSWVESRLQLHKLVPEIATQFVESGLINAANAYQLARLPAHEQPEFVEQAQTLGTAEFGTVVSNRLVQIRKDLVAGRDPSKSRGEFVPVPSLRKAGDVKTADIKTILEGLELKTPEEGAQAAINWCLQLDPDSITAQKERHTLRQRERTEASISKQKERAEALSVKAAERADELKKVLGLA